MSRRFGVAASALFVAFALTACQSIPSSGPVSPGLESLDQTKQPVLFNPSGPSEGATQEEIVRGFVRSATSSTEDYAIAREFLTPEYAQQWSPTDEVFIDDGMQPFTEISENIAELELNGHATVDSRGIMQTLPKGTERQVRFEFEQVDGEWRISSAPNGIILDDSTFSAIWSSQPLYYVNGLGKFVAETRWFLNRPTLTTQLVGELIAGPSPVDAAALHTAFPEGTALASSTVPVVDGTAQIELTSEFLRATNETLELAKQQLAASLASVVGVSRFEISVSGTVIDSSIVAAPESDSRTAQNLQTAIVEDGVLGALSPNGFGELPGLSEPVMGLRPTAVTLNHERTAAAVLHPVQGGATAVSWVDADQTLQIDTRAGLVEPGLDRYGFVWSYASSEPDTVRVVKPGAAFDSFSISGLEGRVPLAVRVSPGGDRIALLVNGGADVSAAGYGQSEVLMLSIGRDSAGQPLGLSEVASTVLWAPGAAIDLDWVDGQRLVALTRTNVSSQVSIATLGQFSVDSGSITGAIAVSGGGSRALIRVLDGDGRMYGPQGTGWQWLMDGVQLIARSG